MHLRLATTLLTAAALLLGACTSPAAQPTPQPTPTSEVTATTVPTTEIAATPIPTPTTTPTPESTITGLFSDPRPRDPDTITQLGPRPASTLPDHDSRSVVLYDTQLNTVRVFGPGIMGVFSPDSRYMAWQEWADDRDDPATLRAIDLQTGEIRELGLSRYVRRFDNERHVRIATSEGLRDPVLVDVVTGERKPIDAIEEKSIASPSARYTLTAPMLNNGVATFHVFGRVPDARPLAIEALDASFASDNELLVLLDAGEGVANIFFINLDTHVATFVATTLTEPFDFSTIPLIATSDYVVWTPNACDYDYYATLSPADYPLLERRPGSTPEVGNTTIYDRAAGTVTELAGSHLWIAAVTPDGRLVDGGFGGDALIDPTTLTWDVVLPPGSSNVNWSPDYRYASVGELLGHGGVCPA